MRIGSQLNSDHGYNWVLVPENEVPERDRTSIPISDIVFDYCDEYYHQILMNLYRPAESASNCRDSITNNLPPLQGTASGDGGHLAPGNKITEDTVDPVVQMATATEPERNRADLITISHVIRDIQMLAKRWANDLNRYRRQDRSQLILSVHRQQQNRQQISKQKQWQKFLEGVWEVILQIVLGLLKFLERQGYMRVEHCDEESSEESEEFSKDSEEFSEDSEDFSLDSEDFSSDFEESSEDSAKSSEDSAKSSEDSTKSSDKWWGKVAIRNFFPGYFSSDCSEVL